MSALMPLSKALKPTIFLARLLALLAVLVYFVTGLGYLGLRYYVWPRLDDWRPQIVARLSQALGHPVSIDRIETGFDGLHPQLRIDGLVVSDVDGQPQLRAGSALAEVSFARPWPPSNWAEMVSLSRLTLQSPQLTVEHFGAGQWRVAGFDVKPEGGDDGRALGLLLAQRHIAIRDARIDWIDRVDDSHLQVTGLDLTLANGLAQHQLEIKAPEAGVARHLRVIADVRMPLLSPIGDWRRWRGQIFVGADDLDGATIAALGERAGLGAAPAPVNVRSGDVLLWSRFDTARLTDALLKFEARGLDVTLPGPEGAARVDRVRAQAAITPLAQGQFQVDVAQARIELSDQARLLSEGNQRLLVDPRGGVRQAAMTLQPFEIEPLLAWLRRQALAPALAAPLQSLAGTGRIAKASVEYARPAPDAGGESGPARLAGQVDFDGLSLARRDSVPTRQPDGHIRPALPQVERLSGSVRFDDRQGSVSLRGDRTTAFIFPGVFEQPRVGLDEFSADIGWQLASTAADPALRLDIRQVSFANGDAAGTLSGHYHSGGDGDGVLEIDGSLSRARVASTARYLPLSLPAPLRRWVADSIVAGRATDVGFRLAGDLEHFPFRPRTAAGRPEEGDFRIVAKVVDGQLRFHKDWPALDQFAGTLTFERHGMDIVMDRGSMDGVALSATHAAIADFKEGLLKIDGQLRAPAQSMIAFVNDSPLREHVGDLLAAARATGDTQLALKLALPLHDLHETQVEGSLQLQGNSLVSEPGAPAVSDIGGVVQFSQDSVRTEGVRGRFLGGDLSVEASSPEPGKVVARAQGTLTIAALRAMSANPILAQLDGQAGYRVNVETGRQGLKFQVDSDLVGLASHLPAPFDKAANVRWPLHIVSGPGVALGDASADVLTTISLKDDIRIAIGRSRQPGSERLLIDRVAFAINGEPVLPEQGLAVTLNMPHVDFDQWGAQLAANPGLVAGGDSAQGAAGPAARAGNASGVAEAVDEADAAVAADAASRGAASAARSAGPRGAANAAGATGERGRTPSALGDEFKPGFSLIPTRVSVVAKELQLAGRDLHDVTFGATQLGGFWRANIIAREIDGYFTWRAAPPGQRVGSLTARFNRLEIPRSRQKEVESMFEARDSDLPSLDVTAEDFVLYGRALGSLKVRAVNTGDHGDPVWDLKELRLSQAAGVLSATGAWRSKSHDQPRSSTLDFTLDLKDSGRMLDEFGVRDAVRGAAGTIGGRIGWNGSPLAFDYPSLAGQLKIDLGKGQFVKTEPGLAKLIGVLNLQSLPKLLTLNFSDIFAEGFAFDEIKGDVTIKDGVAHTDSLQMNGAQAKVRLSGDADLARETQSLDVQVRPIINAGLASLAYAAINPVIGLGSFVAQYVLSKPLEEAFSFEYEIKGSWVKPVVTEKRQSPAASRAPQP